MISEIALICLFWALAIVGLMLLVSAVMRGMLFQSLDLTSLLIGSFLLVAAALLGRVWT